MTMQSCRAWESDEMTRSRLGDVKEMDMTVKWSDLHSMVEEEKEISKAQLP